MKYCASCQTSYPLDYTACPKDQAPLRLLTDLPPGLVLRGKYEIIQKLGAGGMGTVYKARHLAFGELRAIKFVGSHLLADERALGRFKAEAVVARRLQHPNAVKVEDLDTSDDGRPFIVMEYVEGRNLRDLFFERGDVSTKRILALAGQACAALGAAHALGIVHRDIKPDNLMVLEGADGSEILKVADFGLAKVLAGSELSSDQAFTQTGFLLGTPPYMSPEQASGLDVDGRSDLYSLGIVLYEMLTGRLPFRSDTPLGMLIHHQGTPPEPPAGLGVPQPLAALLLKALAKRPEDRFKSAEEMEESLRLLSLMPLPEFVGQGIREGFDPKWTGSRHAARMITTQASPPAPRSSGPLRPTAADGSAATRKHPAPRPTPGARRSPSDGTTRVSPARATPPKFVVRSTDEAASDSSSSRFWLGIAVAGAVGVWFWMNRSAPELVPATPAGVAAAPGSLPAPPAGVVAPPRFGPPASARSGPAPAGAPNSDPTVRTEIEWLLSGSAPLADAHIQVEVANGIVTLVGDAPDQTTAQLAVSLAASVPGVRQVFSTLAPGARANAAAAVAPPDDASPGAVPAPPVGARAEAAGPAGPRPEDATRVQVRALLDQARQKMEAKNPEGAEADLLAAQKLDPDNPMIQDALNRMKNRPLPPSGPRRNR